MLVIPPLLLRTIPAGDIVAQLVADNDKETRAETTVTGTTESPSVINSRRPKGSTIRRCKMFTYFYHGKSYPVMTSDQ